MLWIDAGQFYQFTSRSLQWYWGNIQSTHLSYLDKLLWLLFWHLITCSFCQQIKKCLVIVCQRLMEWTLPLGSWMSTAIILPYFAISIRNICHYLSYLMQPLWHLPCHFTITIVQGKISKCWVNCLSKASGINRASWQLDIDSCSDIFHIYVLSFILFNEAPVSSPQAFHCHWYPGRDQ